MTKFTATFSNGRKFVQNSKRDFTHAWLVTWTGLHQNAGGFSGSQANAEKAANAWAARVRKNGATNIKIEVVAVD